MKYDAVVSAGHGGFNMFDKGAVGLKVEAIENRRVAKRVVEILNSNNMPSLYVEDNVSKNVNGNLYELVRQHNAVDRKVDVQVHFNKAYSSYNGAIGSESFHYRDSNIEWAQDMSKRMSSALKLPNRGAKNKIVVNGKKYDTYFNAQTNRPSLLIEVAFLEATTDMSNYSKYFEELCYSIAESIAWKIGKKLGSASQPQKPQTKPNEGELTMTQYNELKAMINALENKKIDKTMQEDLVPLFKKAYEEKLFTVDHSTSVKEMTYEEALSRLVSYVSRKETK